MTEQERAMYQLHFRLPRMRRRITEAEAAISEWLSRCQRPYVAWSTGKDSTVMLWLVLRQRPDIEVVYFDADSALPDSVALMERLKAEWQLNLRVLKTRPLLDTLAEYGLDHPRIDYYTMRDTVHIPVRQLVAEGYDGVAVGIRSEESRERGLAAAKHAPLWRAKGTGLWTCWPLHNWSARDVWAFIVGHDIPYNAAYDKTKFATIEDMRVSYWAGETGRTYGRYAWLRYYYPELWRELVDRIPSAGHYG